MGATTFSFKITTHDLKSEFDQIVGEQRERFGHRDGYSFNKTSLKMIELPDSVNNEKKITKYINDLFENENHTCNDKWSHNACCIKLPKKTKTEVLEISGAKIENVAQSKTKKVWKTSFLIKNKYGVLVGERATKVLALTFAKEYSQKNKQELTIEETKVLASGNPIINKVVPKYKKVKKDCYTYIIFGTHPE